MAQKGGSRHLKRLALPRALGLPRKGKAWVVKASAGPHPLDRSIPLAVLLRDYFKVAASLREAKKILAKRAVLVDGKPRREPEFPVGFMDVVSIPATRQHFRILISQLGKLIPHPISEEEATFKLCRVERKKVISGGRVQAGLHDGRTLLLDKPDELKVRDVVKISIPEQKILQVVPFEVGSLAFITGGSNVGKIGRILEIKELRSMQQNTAILKSDGESFETILPYIFVIGREEPLISLP
jgi:small subunit ribosomal protein S4e